MKPEVYWIVHEPGGLSVLPRPRGGDYLEDEIGCLRAEGIEVLVSLLTAAECHELGLDGEEQACTKHSVRFISFPIEDRSVPRNADEAARLVRTLADLLKQHRGVGIHCRAGIGRSAMIAAAVLVRLGFAPDEALERISSVRGYEVPDTPGQRTWVEQLAGTV